MAISRAQLVKELEPGLNALFGLEYKRYENQHTEIYTVESSDRAFEEEVMLSGFANAEVKPEGSGVSFDEAQETYTARYTHDTIALAFAITEEAIEDNLYDRLASRYTKALARSMSNAKQVKAVAPLNNGLSSVATFKSGDTVSLFSTNHTTISGTAFKDEDTMSSDSATAVASQQSIKAYVDAAPVGDLTAIVAGSGLTGTSLSGPIPTLNAIGGNGITANADALVIDTSVTVDKTTAQILSSKTLTSPVLNGTLSGTAFLDDDTLADDSAIAVASQQSIKAYVDAQSHSTVTADSVTTFTNKTIDEDATGNSITNLANASIKAAAGIAATKIADGSVSDAEFQRLDGLTSDIQTQLDLKAALASPDLTGNPTAPTQSASDNSTKLATTAYVDGQVATENELSELNDVTIAGIADANYLMYDNAASVWKNKAISGAFTSTKAGVTTLSASIDATKIADGTVTSAEFQYINTLSSNAQTQIDTKATAGFAVAMAIAL